MQRCSPLYLLAMGPYVAVHICEVWRGMSVSCIHRAVVRIQWDNAMKIISIYKSSHKNTEELFEALIGMWDSSHSLQVYGNAGTGKWFYLTFMDQPTLKLTLLYSLCLIKTKQNIIREGQSLSNRDTHSQCTAHSLEITHASVPLYWFIKEKQQ